VTVRLPPRLVLATGNPGKLRELAALLAPWRVEVLPQSAFTATVAEETGQTFVENAILKARHAAAASGLPAIADDSGLEVDALGGAPGVRSARYAGDGADDQANNARLLEALAGVAGPDRTARYRCAMVFLRHPDDPAPLVRQSAWEGCIVREPRGTGGFGYDPLFLVAGEARTAAEYPAEEKNLVSHRGRALRALVEALADGST
jgi:XTP/dITP diphosphohydrolase